MSNCVFLAANILLHEVTPSQDYPIHIDLDNGTVFDGEADDNYCLGTFDDVDIYCDKKYGVYLEPHRFTDGRARQIIDYIKMALMKTDSIELWNVWLSGYWEFDDRPYICKQTIHIDELTVNDIKGIIQAENWNEKDKNRPCFYCLNIII